MNKLELIEKLRAVRVSTSWGDGMGSCQVADFISIPAQIKNDDEIMDELYRAIENRNGAQLKSAADSIDPSMLSGGETAEGVVWMQWTNLEINFDYSDIQKMVDETEI